MCNAHNHPSDCTCGWGGDGHLGSGSGYSGGGWSGGGYDWRERLSEYGESLSFPATCRWCGQEVYIYTNEWGSFVVFDELGWPWPKHDCSSAPSSVRREVEGGDVRALIRQDVPSLLLFHLSRVTQQPITVSRKTVGRAVRSVRSHAPLELHEYLRRLLGKLIRDDLVFPARCGECGATVSLLFTPANASVVMDDVWEGKIHACRSGIHTAKLTAKFNYPDFRKLMLGQWCAQRQPAVTPPSDGKIEGLVVEILGSGVRLLTSAGLYSRFELPGLVQPMDFVRLTVRKGRVTHAERFGLLRGGTAAANFPGWTRRFRLIRRAVVPPRTA